MAEISIHLGIDDESPSRRHVFAISVGGFNQRVSIQRDSSTFIQANAITASCRDLLRVISFSDAEALRNLLAAIRDGLYAPPEEAQAPYAVNLESATVTTSPPPELKPWKPREGEGV